MKKKHAVGRKLMLWLIGLILAGGLCFLLAMGILQILQVSVPAPSPDSDAIIVLGCQVKRDGGLSVQLEYRLTAALEAYRERERPIVVCGAQGADEPAPEGLVMRNWLVAQGVPDDRVLAETESYDTIENLRNAAKLLPEGAEKVTIVTSDYHLPRAMQIARDLGLQADGIGSPCKPEYWLKNHSREVLAWGKYFLHRIINW